MSDMTSPLAILIVDDDRNLRTILVDILQLKGYQPLAAANGAEALRLTHQYDIAVALIDLRLGDMPGLQVMRSIKSINPEVACILLTGHATQDSAIDAINLGAYSYLQKPFDMEQLLLTIQRAIEKRQADLALQESEKHYQALAEVSPVGIYRTDAAGETTYVNPRWSVITGLDYDHGLGLQWLDAVHPDDRERLLSTWRQAVDAQHACVSEYRFVHPNGEIAWVIGQSMPELNAVGECSGYIGTITDITARKRVEDALYRSEAQYRLITTHIEDIVWQMDPDLRFTYVSSAVERVLGYTPQEACQIYVRDLLDETSIAQMEHAFRNRLAHGSPAATAPFEYRMKRKNGQWVTVEVVSSPVYNLEHQMMGFVGVTRDISERKRIEQTLLENELRIQRLLDQQIAVNQLELALGESLDLDTIYQTIYRHVQALADAWIFIVSSYTEQTHLIRAEFAVYEGQAIDVSGFPPLVLAEEGRGNQSQVIHSGQPLYVPDHRQATHHSKQRFAIEKDGAVQSLDDNPDHSPEETLSALYVPMRAKGRNIGIMQLQSRHLDAYTQQDIDLLVAIANVAAVAIQNASLHGEVQRELEERKRAEEQLLLRSAALEAAANAIIITDNQGMAQWVNSAFATLSGYPEDEAVGRQLRDLQSALQEPSIYTSLWETISSGKTWRNELVNRRKDGSQYAVEETITPLRDANGSITHYICINQDISERKQSEAAIRRHLSELEVLYENGLKLARLIERSEIAQCIIDLITERLHWHHVVLRLYDAAHGKIEVVGMSHAGIPPDQLDTERRRLDGMRVDTGVGLAGWVLAHGQPVRSGNLESDPRLVVTYEGMKSGLYVPIMAPEWVIGVISVESDEPDAFTSADERLLVTLAAQAAAAFENARLYGEAYQRLEELTAVAQISAALRAASGRDEMLPIILDQTIIVLHGLGAAFASMHTALGEVAFEWGVGVFSWLMGQPLPPERGRIAQVFETGELYLGQFGEMEVEAPQSVSASLSSMYVVFAPLVSQTQTIGVILLASREPFTANQVSLLRAIVDIAANAIQRSALFEQTFQYAAELEQRVEERTTELRIANFALERASRSKDEFLASMSHELRTPLTGILNLSEVLQEQIYGSLNEKQLHYVHTIEESGRHLLGLINDILDISKIEAGQFDLQFDVFQVDMVCQASLQLTRGLAGKKNQQVSYSISPPEIELYADVRRLKQMLVNLLGNAVKFTPAGGKIGLEVKADEQRKVIAFTVWDTGIGIAAENFSRLFKPFSQLDASLSRHYEGTGLGLAIVQRLADKHGGSIHLESIPGQGSRFTIQIPWRVAPVQEQTKERDGQAAFGSTRPRYHSKLLSGSTQSHPPLLLLADDNQVNIEIYADYLRESGFEVVLAYDGQDALEMLHQYRPDLILMDIQMPGMDGMTAIRRIRSLEDSALAQLPVIALTALTMPGDRERCLDAGATDYLSKPVGLQDLLRTICTYLDS